MRKAGQEAQTRIYAKKNVNEAAVNKITANGPRRSSGAGAGGGEQKKKLRCYKCNNNHFARDCTSDPERMKCKDCGDNEAFRRNPHYTGAYFCPKVKKPAKNEGGKPQANQPPNRRVRKIEKNEDGSNTDVEYTDTEGETSDDGYERGRNFTGKVDLFGPSHLDPKTVILHKKARAALMFRQNYNLVPTTAEADTGSDFTLMWEKFANKHKIKFNRDGSIYGKFMLTDISGHEVQICGYVDIEVCIIGGRADFVKTRVLIVTGWQRRDSMLILGRPDLKLLGLVGENFPQPMQKASSNMERQARARTLIKMEAEECENVNNDKDVNPVTVKKEMGEKEEAKPVAEKKKRQSLKDWKKDLAWAEAYKIQEREEKVMMRLEKKNGIFLWRAGSGDCQDGQDPPGKLINRNLMDNSNNKSAEERQKVAEHERERERYLHLGLQQVLYIKKAFDLSLDELINLVVREDDKTKGFPHHTRRQIYDLMKDKSPPCCKLVKLHTKTNSCGLCKPEIDVLVTKSSSKSYISTQLAVQLMAALETAGMGHKTDLGQSEPASKIRAGEGTQGRIAELQSSIAAGEEDVRRQVKELHIELSNGFHWFNGEQGGDHGEKGREHERGRVSPGRDESYQHTRRNCADKLSRHSDYDLFPPRPLQVHAKTWMLEEEEDSGACLSGMSNEGDADDEFASCCSDDVFSEESDDDNGGTAGEVVEFMVPEWLASTEDAEYAAEVQQGIPKRERGGGPEKTARAQPAGDQGAGAEHGTPGGLGWDPEGTMRRRMKTVTT